MRLDKDLSPRSPDEIDALIGEKIRQKRLLSGLSQEQLGQKLGLSFQQVQKYERGFNRVTASRLFQIAKTLDVDIMTFYHDLDPDKKAHSVEESFLSQDMQSSKELKDMMRHFSKIDNSNIRKKLLQLTNEVSKAITNTPHK